MNRLLVVACSTLLAIPALADGETTIEQIAPENSVIVIGVENAQETMKRAQNTSLWALWHSDQMADARTEFMTEFHDGITEMLEELDLDEGALVPPTGALGFALYSSPDEMGMVEARMLALADYGDNADKTQELIEAAVEKAADDGSLDVDEEEVLGRTVTSLTKIEEEVVEDEWDDAPMGMPLPDAEDFFGDLSTVYYVREGQLFLMSSSLDGIRGALETIDEGEPDGTGFAKREDYRKLKGQLGDVDAWSVVLFRDMFGVIGGAEGMDMMMMMAAPLIEALFGDISGASVGMRVDADSAMVEQSFAVYMPNGKVGIPALFEKQTPRGELPPFVGPDTVNYAAVNIEVNEIPDLVRNVVQSTPMLQMQMGEQLPQVIAVVEQICSSLGTEAHQVVSVQRPITVNSLPQIFAIECTEPEALESAIAGLAPQTGLEPRDFLGHRIFAPSEAMMPMGAGGEQPPSFGIGGGYLIIGPAAAVEQALRSVDGAADGGLDADAEYQRAVSLIGNGAMVTWGYSDIVESMEVTLKVQELANEQMMAQMREEFPEFADELEGQQEDVPDFLKDMDYDELRRYLGPTVWFMQSTEDGFYGRSYLLGPAE